LDEKRKKSKSAKNEEEAVLSLFCEATTTDRVGGWGGTRSPKWQSP